MTTLSSSNRSDVGILIVEEFIEGQDGFFIETACPQQKFPTTMRIKWHDPSHKQPDEFSFIYGNYGQLRSEQYYLHLFAIPSSLPKNFLINDLQMPVQIRGSLLIVNLQNVLSRQPDQRKLFELTWIKKNDLPFAICVIGSGRTHGSSVDQLYTNFGLEPNTPIISCSVSFDKNNVENVLSVLIDHIHSTGSL